MSEGVTAELEALGPLGKELARRARGEGLAMIWRAQVREARRVLVRKGRPEDTSHTSSSGHGIQVFTYSEEELVPVAEACATTWPKLEKRMTKELMDEFRAELAPSK